MIKSILECETITYRNHHFPWHLHPTCSTFSHILEGEGLLVFADVEVALKKGTTIFIPPGVPHQSFVPDTMTYQVIRIELEQFPAPFHYQKSYWTWSNEETREVFSEWFTQLQKKYKSLDFRADQVLIPTCFRNSGFAQNKPTPLFDDAISRVVAHLHQTYDEALVLADLCKVAQQSSSHFRRTFKSMTGISPMKYLLSLRIDKSKALIRNGVLLTEVALATGFYDQSHFNKYFRILSGMNPTAYREIVAK